MISPTLTVVGENEFLLSFARAAEIFEDSRPELEDIGDGVFLAIRRRFDAEGPGWSKLSTSYAARKARRFGSKPILRATDKLYGSFAKGAENSITRISAVEGEWGTSDPIGMFHQEGAGKLPQRVIINIEPDEQAKFGVTFFNSKAARLRTIGFQVN